MNPIWQASEQSGETRTAELMYLYCRSLISGWVVGVQADWLRQKKGEPRRDKQSQSQVTRGAGGAADTRGMKEKHYHMTDIQMVGLVLLFRFIYQ